MPPYIAYLAYEKDLTCLAYENFIFKDVSTMLALVFAVSEADIKRHIQAELSSDTSKEVIFANFRWFRED